MDLLKIKAFPICILRGMNTAKIMAPEGGSSRCAGREKAKRILELP